MRIAICDDDEKIVHLIKSIIEDYYKERKSAIPQIDCFYSGESLIKDKSKKDIVFLDIEMPGYDGIVTGKKLLEINKSTLLIIITSYAEYLDDAMRIDVFRYISKPIDSKRLKRNFSDAIGAYNLKTRRKIAVETSRGIVRFSSSEIIMLEMIGRKVTMHTGEGTYITDKSLKEWKEILPENMFYLCHRSFIVNISHIKKIKQDKIVMDMDNQEAYLTKRKYSEIKKAWMLYMETAN